MRDSVSHVTTLFIDCFRIIAFHLLSTVSLIYLSLLYFDHSYIILYMYIKINFYFYACNLFYTTLFPIFYFSRFRYEKFLLSVQELIITIVEIISYFSFFFSLQYQSRSPPHLNTTGWEWNVRQHDE